MKEKVDKNLKKMRKQDLETVKMRKQDLETVSVISHSKQSSASQKHTVKNKLAKSGSHLQQRVIKKSQNLETKKEAEHRMMSTDTVNLVVKRSKKQKRIREDQSVNGLKEKTCEGDYADDCTSPPAAKKLKGPVGPQLTRKQRRNRKKNCSKKNKYKHLALNNRTGEGNKAGAGIFNVVHETKDRKQAAALSGSKSVQSQENNPLEADTQSAWRAVSSQQRRQNSSTREETPVTSLKKQKKRKAKSQKQTESVKFSHRRSNIDLAGMSDLPQMSDTDLSDMSDMDLPEISHDDDSIQDSFHHKHSDSLPKRSVLFSPGTGCEVSQSHTSPKKIKQLSIVDQARNKLNAARFRFLNEQLYTSTGAKALKMFQDDPEAFKVYHQGFQLQVSQWPFNPLDVIIKELVKLPQSTVMADFGCGDARLAESLPHNVVHSFDLVSTKPCITACDIAKVPLEKSSVGVAVFCLSLMGTNLSDYLCEANRVLQKGGLLKIAEVVSRFYSISRFMKNVEALGFHMQKKKFLGKMFMMFTFKKIKDSSRKHAPRIQLKACYYKRR